MENQSFTTGDTMVTMDTIVSLAKKAHRTHWRMSGQESEGDKMAATVTKEWQSSVLNLSNEFEAEFPIECGCNEKIDLFDTRNGIAYELKASPNNAHFEFYRDIFKVLVCNKGRKGLIKKFIFLVPGKGFKHLQRGLGKEVQKLDCNIEISIEVIEI